MRSFLVLAAAAAISVPAYAYGLSAERRSFWGCGQSERGAYHVATTAASEHKEVVRRRCTQESESATFRYKLSKGVCHFNEGDPSCAVECVVHLRTECVI